MDNDNVFAAGSQSGGPSGGGPRGAAPVDLMALFERAWKLLLDNLAVVGLAMVLFIGISMAGGGINFALQMWGELSEDETTKMIAAILNLISQLFFTLVQIFLNLGLLKMLITLDRGGEAELDMLWGQGGSFLSAVIASIVVGIAVVLGFILLIVPGVIIGLGLSMTMLIIIDRGSDPISAIQESWELTDGHKTFLFMQGLLMFVLTMAIYCFTCMLGAPIAVALYAALQAVTYNAILNAKASSV